MTLGRPISFDPEQAVDEATQVFWAKGYTATSMSDLLDATQLSRSSLYQTFTSKQALFQRCLHQYCDDLIRRLRDALSQAPGGREFIEQTFLQIARQADNPDLRQGCLAMNTAIELGHTGSPLAGEVHKGLQRFTRIFSDAVRQAQREGTISSDKKASDLAHYLISNMCGLRMLIKCGVSPAQATRVSKHILRALD